MNRGYILKKYNERCAYCGDAIKIDNFHVDHIIPKKGIIPGKNELSNYNPSCCACNCSKSSSSIDEWRDRLKLKLSNFEENTIYRILKRRGLIKEVKKDLLFYFETL